MCLLQEASCHGATTVLEKHKRHASQSASEPRPASRRTLYPRFVTKDIPCSCLVSNTSNGKHTCMDIGTGNMKAVAIKPTSASRRISENTTRYSEQTSSCTDNSLYEPNPRVVKTGIPDNLTKSLPNFSENRHTSEHPLEARCTRDQSASSRSVPGTMKPGRTSLSYTNGVLDSHQHAVEPSGSDRGSSTSSPKFKPTLYPRFATTVMMPTASAHCEKLFESLTSAGYPAPQSEPTHEKKPCTSSVSCQTSGSKADRWTSALCIKQFRQTFKTVLMSCKCVVVKTFDSSDSARGVDAKAC